MGGTFFLRNNMSFLLRQTIEYTMQGISFLLVHCESSNHPFTLFTSEVIPHPIYFNEILTSSPKGIGSTNEE